MCAVFERRLRGGSDLVPTSETKVVCEAGSAPYKRRWSVRDIKDPAIYTPGDGAAGSGDVATPNACSCRSGVSITPGVNPMVSFHERLEAEKPRLQ